MERINFESALDLVLSYARPKPKTADTFRVERIGRLLARLKYEQNYPIIHVAGTKGKGSTCAMIAAATEANGLRVGLYTSPHLESIRERIQINQGLIEPERFAEIVQQIKPYLEQIEGLGFPEVMMAIGLVYFSQEKVDIAVVETHIGGRFDPTNVVKPLVSVITPISYDHTELLGESLVEIATHKAGIIKPGVPVVSAPQVAEAESVITQTAAEQAAPLTLLGRNWFYETLPVSLEGQAIRLISNITDTQKRLATNHDNIVGTPFLASAPLFTTNLIGAHQATNLATSLATLEQIHRQGITLSAEHSQAGLLQVRWQGRFEIISQTATVILDGAHNPESAQMLRYNLATLFPQAPVVLVYASKESKDADSILRTLLPITHHLILTRIPDAPSQGTDQLREIALRAGYDRGLEIIPDLETALTTGFQRVAPDGLICITGSLFLVGSARHLLLFGEHQ
jgi:dihydrofolate synthase/folylpolyglutamate synthase